MLFFSMHFLLLTYQVGHEAADGRGLSELEGCRKNYAMLNMILDDWMPWHKDNYDFSSMDINRSIQIL